jgi:hypothetical protein
VALVTIGYKVTNRTCVGEWHYGKTFMVNDQNVVCREARAKPKSSIGKNQVPRSSEEWIEVSVPAIIDRDIFDLAQHCLQENKL